MKWCANSATYVHAFANTWERECIFYLQFYMWLCLLSDSWRRVITHWQKYCFEARWRKAKTTWFNYQRSWMAALIVCWRSTRCVAAGAVQQHSSVSLFHVSRAKECLKVSFYSSLVIWIKMFSRQPFNIHTYSDEVFQFFISASSSPICLREHLPMQI